jgi:hypothetical protein
MSADIQNVIDSTAILATIFESTIPQNLSAQAEQTVSQILDPDKRAMQLLRQSKIRPKRIAACAASAELGHDKYEIFRSIRLSNLLASTSIARLLNALLMFTARQIIRPFFCVTVRDHRLKSIKLKRREKSIVREDAGIGGSAHFKLVGDFIISLHEDMERG